MKITIQGNNIHIFKSDNKVTVSLYTDDNYLIVMFDTYNDKVVHVHDIDFILLDLILKPIDPELCKMILDDWDKTMQIIMP